MITAAGDYILVEPIPETEIGGIVIPDQAQAKERGTVLSVGPDCPHSLTKGMIVIYQKNEGTPVADKYLALLPERVLAISEGA